MPNIEDIPNFDKLVGAEGQARYTAAFRKGKPTDCYVELRKWCYEHDINFADILNETIVGIAYFCQNFARLDENNHVVVTINLGDVTFRPVRRPKTINQRGVRAYKDHVKQTPKEKNAKSYLRHII